MASSISAGIRILLLTVFALVGVACGGGGGGDTSPSPNVNDGTSDQVGGVQSTTISGKVKLSGTIVTAQKPGYAKLKALADAPKMKSAGSTFRVAKKPGAAVSGSTMPGFAAGDVVSSATVWLYDADHPEWLYPVAEAATDADGNYTLSVLKNAANNNNAYTDGDPIPVGNYTLMAYKPGGFDPILGVTTDPVVAVQQVVSEFSGSVSGNDLTVQPSDVTPRVVTMFGKKKNLDGTYTWGDGTVTRPENYNIQLTFDMAMSRGNIANHIRVLDGGSEVTGTWTMSADWLTATFVPDNTLTVGNVVTVEVDSKILNVYGNEMGFAASGSFTVVSSDQDSPMVSVSTPSSLSESIRITANEALDVNSLLLKATPSVGVKPGVLFLGETASGFVYEFILGEPLQLGTGYSFTISGIADPAGNTAADLSGSFTTASAAATAGVDSSADSTTQTAQANVKDAFGKWYRAMSDGSLAQLQNMMSGDFIFEYDINQGFVDEDFNRDGRLKLKEFSAMMESAFLQWDYCGTNVVGDIVGTINVAGDTADFEFNFNSSTSTKQTPECAQSLPVSAFYATLKNLNGAWSLVRLSEGIDTRDKAIVTRTVIEATLTGPDGTVVANGGQVSEPVSPMAPFTFNWNHETGTSSYILLISNARDPSRLGLAFVLDADATVEPEKGTKLVDSTTGQASLTIPVTTPSGLPAAAVDISAMLFDREQYEDAGFDRPGEEFYWEVIGLGTSLAYDFASSAVSAVNMVRDITALSTVKRFVNPGTRKELTVGVQDVSGNPLTFNEILWGYDAGASDLITLTLHSANPNTSGYLYVNSMSGWNAIPLQFDANGDASFDMALSDNPDCAPGAAPGTNQVCLFQGQNWIDIWDGTDLSRGFSVITTGGIPPVMALTSVGTDAGGVTLDPWSYAQAPTGATTVSVNGTVDTSNHPEFGPGATLQVTAWVWNNNGANAQVSGSYDPATGVFSFANLPIYSGDNWVSINLEGTDPSGMWVWASTYFGIWTDTGSAWVPPIAITGVSSTSGNATLTGDWGMSSDWDASAITLNAEEVIISGTMATSMLGMGQPMYWVSADGFWSEGSVSVDPSTGAFSITIPLYNGWSWISFDNGNGAWYGLNIYTSNGTVLPKPKIQTVNGVAVVDNGYEVTANTTGCSATITGSASANTALAVDWNGSDAVDYYWESQQVTTDANGSFTFTVPLIGGSGAYNYVNVYDQSNWLWAGAQISTSDSSCTYSAPMMTFDSVSAGGVVLTPDMYGDYDAGAASIVTLTGTSSVPGRVITVENYICSGVDRTSTTAAITMNGNGSYDWSVTVNVYDGAQSLNVSDGMNWDYANVYTLNGVVPTPPITVDLPIGVADMGGGCGYNSWDAGTLNSVMVSGTTTAPDGWGEYWTDTGWGSFEIIGGSFAFTVDLYDGYNYVSISDTNWNNSYVEIVTTNGMMRPQYVTITSPQNNAQGLSGVTTVSGTISDPTSSGYSPNYLSGYVSYYDDTTGMWVDQYLSSDPNDAQWGYVLISYASGSFSFSADIPAGATDVYISVDGCDAVACHGHSISVNTTSTTPDYYYKPGASATVAKPDLLERHHRKQRAEGIKRFAH